MILVLKSFLHQLVINDGFGESSELFTMIFTLGWVLYFRFDSHDLQFLIC